MNRLKEIRKQNNLTQDQVAAIIGVAKTTYCNYEIGRTEMEFNSIIKLAKYYNVSIDYLMGVEETENIYISKEDFKKMQELKEIVTKIENSLK